MEYQPKPGAPAIVTLGAVQILSWGGSFYLMAVMANPIIAETGWSQQWVYGALSLGILVSGLLAPLCGRLIARAHGRRLLAASGAVMALGLVIMALSHSLPLFLFAWLIIGAGMAMGLYDALFATLGTLYGGQARGAITGITLISGFCTSLVWPGIALLIHWLEWRGACLAIAALLCLAVLPAYLYALPAPRTPSRPKATQQHTAQNSLAPTLFWLLCSIFTLASVIMTAISVQLITPAAGERAFAERRAGDQHAAGAVPGGVAHWSIWRLSAAIPSGPLSSQSGWWRWDYCCWPVIPRGRW